jgi:recombination protein RecA
MPSAATVRREIELSLEARFPAALSPAARTLREVASTGVEAADRILDGGLPVGAISEIVGPASSGRTSLAISFLAQRIAEGRTCAWVDVEDALDPESAAANGVNLKQLLWVRCRPEGPGLEQSAPRFHRDAKTRPIWTRLDQALRATDLLLQAGGFAAIVLDLADTAPEHGCRIPLATWFRFRQAADRTRCSLVLLGRAAFAQSSAAVALECGPLRAQAEGGTVLRGFSTQLSRQKQRFAPGFCGAKKGPASTWQAGVAWNADAEKRA